MPASSWAMPPYIRARPKTTGSVPLWIQPALTAERMKVVSAKAASPSGPGSAMVPAKAVAVSRARAVWPAIGSRELSRSTLMSRSDATLVAMRVLPRISARAAPPGPPSPRRSRPGHTSVTVLSQFRRFLRRGLQTAEEVVEVEDVGRAHDAVDHAVVDDREVLDAGDQHGRARLADRTVRGAHRG